MRAQGLVLRSRRGVPSVSLTGRVPGTLTPHRAPSSSFWRPLWWICYSLTGLGDRYTLRQSGLGTTPLSQSGQSPPRLAQGPEAAGPIPQRVKAAPEWWGWAGQGCLLWPLRPQEPVSRCPTSLHPGSDGEGCCPHSQGPHLQRGLHFSLHLGPKANDVMCTLRASARPCSHVPSLFTYFQFLYPSESSELHVGILSSLQPETFDSVSPTLRFNTPKVRLFILLF